MKRSVSSTMNASERYVDSFMIGRLTAHDHENDIDLESDVVLMSMDIGTISTTHLCQVPSKGHKSPASHPRTPDRGQYNDSLPLSLHPLI